MTDDTKQLIQLQLEMLKQTMKENGVMFAFVVNKDDIGDSSLAFMDVKQYFANGKRDGFQASLTELNKDII